MFAVAIENCFSRFPIFQDVGFSLFANRGAILSGHDVPSSRNFTYGFLATLGAFA
jgi:hypothetical protein